MYVTDVECTVHMYHCVYMSKQTGLTVLESSVPHLALTWGVEGHDGVASLVTGHQLPVLLLDDGTLPLGAHEDLVPGVVQVLGRDRLPPFR